MEHKQNNLFLQLSENFLEKVLQKVQVFCEINKLMYPLVRSSISERQGSWNTNITKWQNLMKSCQTSAKGEEMRRSLCREHFLVLWQ